jgi:hypothetical protein
MSLWLEASMMVALSEGQNAGFYHPNHVMALGTEQLPLTTQPG